MACYQKQPSFIAVIGDIVDSKKLKNRYQVQENFRAVLEDINVRYSDDIASNFMITLGDEFQGLLKSCDHIMDIIADIEMKMYPIQMRFGIGIGSITTEINRLMPLGADGPAYHCARNMIQQIKANERKVKSNRANIMIASEGEDEMRDMLVNAIFSLCATLQNKWSPRQREIIYSYVQNSENQVKTAESLGISQSSVHKALHLSGYYTYKQAVESVILALKGGHCNV